MENIDTTNYATINEEFDKHLTVYTDNYLTEELLGVFLKERFNLPFVHNKPFIKGRRFTPDYNHSYFGLIVEFDGYHHYTKVDNCINDQEKYKLYSELGNNVIRVPYYIQLDTKGIISLFGEYELSRVVHNALDGNIDEVYDRLDIPKELIPNNETSTKEQMDGFDEIYDQYGDKYADYIAYYYAMKSVKPFNTYAHGFIAKNVVLPAEFCSLGLNRFYNEMNQEFKEFRKDIMDSLNKKVAELGNILMVYPLSMLDKIIIDTDEEYKEYYIVKPHILDSRYSWGT